MAQWAKEADRVCAEINAEVEALPKPGNDLATFDAYIGRIRQLLTTEQTKIADLDGPDGDLFPTAPARTDPHPVPVLSPNHGAPPGTGT